MTVVEPGPKGRSITPEAIVVWCAVPAEFDAEGLAESLVRRSLAACVQVGPGVTSVYSWKGALEKSAERILFIKTRRDLFPSVEDAIRAVHPYDVPEIVAVTVSAGHAPYLAWMAEATSR